NNWRRVSVSTAGAQANGGSDTPTISADGRYVVFQTAATNLFTGDTNGFVDVVRYDLMTGTLERMSQTTAGAAGGADSTRPSISANGRYVAFDSTFLYVPAA